MPSLVEPIMTITFDASHRHCVPHLGSLTHAPRKEETKEVPRKPRLNNQSDFVTVLPRMNDFQLLHGGGVGGAD